MKELTYLKLTYLTRIKLFKIDVATMLESNELIYSQNQLTGC